MPSLKKHWIIVVLPIALIGGLGAYAFLQPGPPVTAARVERGTLRAYVEERASTHVPGAQRLSMPEDGRIETIDLEPGTPVAAGDLVARLATADLDDTVAVARAELGRIDAQLAVLRDNAIANTALNEAEGWIATIAKLAAAAEEVIAAHQANVGFSDWWKSAEQKLKKVGAISDEQLRRAQTNSSQASVDLAVSKLDHQIVLAIGQVFQLGPKYIHDYLDLKGLEAAVLQRQREAAAARLALAERARARAEIRAPAAGIVLTRAVRDTQVLPAGTELLTIGDLAALHVRADLLSQDAGRVREGDAVDISGVAGMTLTGKVIRVHPQAFTKRSSLGVDQQRVSVDIAFDDGELARVREAGERLGADYRVQVRVYTDSADQALMIPSLALFRGDDGGWRVYRVDAGTAVEQPVAVGLSTPDAVQVVKGLSGGDLVIVSPPKDLTAGTRVTPVVAVPVGG
ncbi:HlyD family efflux transporter periplasmic adaptor subunit [uncultured Thiodictyon sp.]|uniref:efflux RND transporter periplasmic adaptor subunit n=1 Tax=uncultured Thiodictyon sp. TaxID=1846217 RepID=UPI0025D51D79|nr:HlyD family efflux transporter periplasmic adaptor subunit [uncultured Thiodictyon sp.]